MKIFVKLTNELLRKVTLGKSSSPILKRQRANTIALPPKLMWEDALAFSIRKGKQGEGSRSRERKMNKRKKQSKLEVKAKRR